MIDEERDCIDIITQFNAVHAVRSSVDRVIELLIIENLMEYIITPLENSVEQKEK